MCMCACVCVCVSVCVCVCVLVGNYFQQSNAQSEVCSCSKMGSKCQEQVSLSEHTN